MGKIANSFILRIDTIEETSKWTQILSFQSMGKGANSCILRIDIIEKNPKWIQI